MFLFMAPGQFGRMENRGRQASEIRTLMVNKLARPWTYMLAQAGVHGPARPEYCARRAAPASGRERRGCPAETRSPARSRAQAIRLGDGQPKPFLSSGRVEAFQNSPSVCEV